METIVSSWVTEAYFPIREARKLVNEQSAQRYARALVCLAERHRLEREAMDAALSGLSQADWAQHAERLMPTLGAMIRKRLADGRSARELHSIRQLIYERIRLEAASAPSVCSLSTAIV